VGFENPFYPQNYPQKIRVGFDALPQMLSIILAEERFRGEVFRLPILLLPIVYV